MPETTQTSGNLENTVSANDPVFLEDTRNAAMHVISIAEARSQFAKAGMTSQWAKALFLSMLGSIGIDFQWSQVEHAAHLVRLRAMAANNEIFLSTGTDK
jgi:hypothetical protein